MEIKEKNWDSEAEELWTAIYRLSKDADKIVLEAVEAGYPVDYKDGTSQDSLLSLTVLYGDAPEILHTCKILLEYGADSSASSFR